MRGNILAFLFTLGSIALAALCVVFYGRSDQTPPEFRFTAMELTYDAETKEAELLQGIAAYDGTDGDVTDRIVVEKVVLNETRGTAVVYYAVSDYSGNVTKQSRVFPADISSFAPQTDEESGAFPMIEG